MPAHTDIMGRRYRPDIMHSSQQCKSSYCPGHLQRPVFPSCPGQGSEKVDGGLSVQGRESRSQRSDALLHRAGRPRGWRRCSAFLFRSRTTPRQEAWHDSQQRKRRERSRLDRCLAADDRQYRKLALPICVTPRARGERPRVGPQNERLVTFEPAFSKTRLSDQAGISHPDFFLPVADTRAHRCQ